jgi:hypothetical protein
MASLERTDFNLFDGVFIFFVRASD